MKAAVVCLMLLAISGARGQCLIGGAVRDAETGRPLARVRVFAKPPAQRPDAPAEPAKPAILRITDAAGAFCFDRLDAASYQVLASHAGYLTAVYGARPGQTDGTFFNVDGRTAQPPLTIRMVAGATIAGTVLDDHGQPVEEAMVDLQRKKWDWIWEPSHVTFARSGPGGAFRMPPVPAGTYFIRVDPVEPVMRGPILDALGLPDPGPLRDEKGRTVLEAATSTFYNGSYSFAHATPIVVKPGQEVANLVVSMKPLVVRHISGRVSGGFDPKALSQAEVDVSSVVEIVGPSGRETAASIRPDGAFTVGGLSPFEYDVKVTGLPASLTAQVDLSAGDVDGLVLEPVRAVDFTVSARIEGQDAAPTQPMAICDLEHGCQQRNPPDDQGVYRFNAVRQGVYRFHTRGPGVYVKSVTVDGKPLADGQLDLRRGAPESIAVVLGPHLATLDGQVERTATQTPGLTVSVMLVAEIRYSPAVSNIFVAADSAGRFHFDDVTPGLYHVLAIEGFDDGPWGSPELFAALAAKAVAVEIGEGQKKAVALPVVSSAEWEAALRKVGM